MPTPLTISFGPWAPDLANNGIQVMVYPPAQTIPVVDAYDVYYQDGSYRCTPSPSSIGPTLGVPVLNAANWYDDSTNTEEIFAATASGMYMLAGGVWSAVPLQLNTNVSQPGVLISVTLANLLALSIYPAPQTATSVGSGLAFSEVVGGGPAGASYVWTFPSTSGTGSWSILSGAGTAAVGILCSGMSAGTRSTATVQCAVTSGSQTVNVTSALSAGYMTGMVSGPASGTFTTNPVTASAAGGVAPLSYSWSAPAGATATTPSSATTTFTATSAVTGTATCTITDATGTPVMPTCTVTLLATSYTGTVTVGASGGSYGYDAGAFGSISPSADTNGNLIVALVIDTSGYLNLYVNNATLAQTYFTTLVVNGASIASSAASFSTGGGNSVWQWTSFPAFTFNPGSTYNWGYS